MQAFPHFQSWDCLASRLPSGVTSLSCGSQFVDKLREYSYHLHEHGADFQRGHVLQLVERDALDVDVVEQHVERGEVEQHVVQPRHARGRAQRHQRQRVRHQPAARLDVPRARRVPRAQRLRLRLAWRRACRLGVRARVLRPVGTPNGPDYNYFPIIYTEPRVGTITDFNSSYTSKNWEV